MSKIELKSIGEIANSDMHFFIPNYQRGYRWTNQQVEDLLNDILYFYKNATSGIYCIQPLVVKGHPQEGAITEIKKMFAEDKQPSLDDIKEKCKTKKWEVIDGQQRLTTIHILLSYLKSVKKYSLEYATRVESSIFLNTITQDKEEKKKENKDYNGNIDFFYMHQAYNTMSNWFRSRQEDKILSDWFHTRGENIVESIKKTLLEKVKFIWYETKEFDPIKVFTRLNIGKIPLTDAELVKAIFLNESNFGEQENSAAIRLQQQEIAAEWDKIEFTLQNDEFWLFIHNKNWLKPTRIDFILDLLFEKDVLNLRKMWIEKYIERNPDDTKNAEIEWEKCIGTDEHKTFRYFYEYFIFHKEKIQRGEKGFRLRDDIWRKIKNLFQVFNEWFNDLEMYHYIGFLIETGTDIKCLIDTWQESGSQGIFLNGTDGLKKQIMDKLHECNDLTKEYETSGNPKNRCKPLLLLFNIQTVINQNLALEKSEKYGLGAFYKFPFHLFKMEGRKNNGKGWEIEHIASNAGDDFEDLEKQRIYLAQIKYSLTLQEELKKQIDEFLKGSSSVDFLKINEKCKKIVANTNPIPDKYKNFIWNFALLDSSTNEEYQNAPFPIKRICILAKENGKKATFTKILDQGKLKINYEPGIAFVPPCTRDVFTKSYTNIPASMNAWTLLDATEYLRKINTVLSDFIPDQSEKIKKFITESNCSGENK